jgi:phosphotransferase system enzyme I (PtsP)
MLKDIQRIIQDMSKASNLADALQSVVDQVVQMLHVPAANIFLLDPERGNYALVVSTVMAREDFAKSTIPFGRGLVGQVAERSEIINIDDAQVHEALQASVELLNDDFHGYCVKSVLNHRALVDKHLV